MKITSKTITHRRTILSLLNIKNNDKLTTAIRLNLVRYYPNRFEIAIDENLDGEYIDLAHCIDYIDFHYRRYLCGFHKTLHRVVHEIREFQRMDLYNKKSVIEVLELVEGMLLENEIYELMGRHKAGKKRVLAFLEHPIKPLPANEKNFFD